MSNIDGTHILQTYNAPKYTLVASTTLRDTQRALDRTRAGSSQSRGLATISSSPEIRIGCSPAANHCRVTRGERPRRVSRLEQRLNLAIEACAHHSERTATPIASETVGRVVVIAVLDAEQHATPMVRLGQLGQRVAARAILQITALRRARAYPVRSAPLRGRDSERALLVERRRLGVQLRRGLAHLPGRSPRVRGARGSGLGGGLRGHGFVVRVASL